MRWPSWTATCWASATLAERRVAAKRSCIERVVREVGEALQRLRVFECALAERRADELRQSGVGFDEPAAEGDAVGLVDDAAGIEGVAGCGTPSWHQIGVQGRNAVDLVRADEGEIAHAHPPAGMFVDQRERGEKA